MAPTHVGPSCNAGGLPCRRLSASRLPVGADAVYGPDTEAYRYAIRIAAGRAHIDYGQCISCFCCQEFCQSDAVAVGHSRCGEAMLLVLRGVRRFKKALSGK